MFAVLKPEFTPNGGRKPNGEVIYTVGWEKIGEAKGMESARALSRAPVLSNDPRWIGADVGAVRYI